MFFPPKKFFAGILCAFARTGEKFGLPLLLLVVRLWMARIFWRSGLTKIDSWDSTVALFQHEYKVPFVSPEIAAHFAAAIELSCPILLALGLLTRLAAIPMLAMVLVIQFTYLDLTEHFYWMMLLCLLIFKGAGALSIDGFMMRRHCSK